MYVRIPLCLLIVFALLLFCDSAGAQPAEQASDMVVSDLVAIATFEEAVSLDIDPAGTLYVVDAGSHSIMQLTPEGEVMQQLGGPGDGEGQFDSPADIDVTNGLVLVVADAGNGRIQRFSREFLFLESLPLHAAAYKRQDAFGGEPAYRQQTETGNNTGTGRPIALITADDNTMYVVDEVNNAVLAWDAQRNFLREIGAYDQGDGSLFAPVAATLSDTGSLFVVDQGRGAVVVYDAFGGFDRLMAAGMAEDAKAITTHGAWLLLVRPQKLVVFQTRGLLEQSLVFEIGEPMQDAAVFGETLYILGTSTLYRTPWSPIAPR